MDERFGVLMNHELMALLDALRRDLRSEQDKVGTDTAWSDVHARNVRTVKRLLEALNPKQVEKQAYQARIGMDVEQHLENMLMTGT